MIHGMHMREEAQGRACTVLAACCAKCLSPAAPMRGSATVTTVTGRAINCPPPPGCTPISHPRQTKRPIAGMMSARTQDRHAPVAAASSRSSLGGAAKQRVETLLARPAVYRVAQDRPV